jgi:Ca2+-binding RTX toxin-like protein
MHAGTASGGGTGGSGRVNFSDIEAVEGTRFNDRLSANDAAQLLGGRGSDTLRGGGGDDFLSGDGTATGFNLGSGNDRISGRGGNDFLEGGAGNDSFVFDVAPSDSNADTVAAFVSGADRLELDDAAHANIGSRGRFMVNDDRFFAGDGATSGQDAEDRVVYDTSTGNLYYDADGSGSDGSQLIATFQGNPAIAATDIVVI